MTTISSPDIHTITDGSAALNASMVVRAILTEMQCYLAAGVEVTTHRLTDQTHQRSETACAYDTGQRDALLAAQRTLQRLCAQHAAGIPALPETSEKITRNP